VMNKSLMSLVLASALSLPAAAEPLTYLLDPTHTIVHFELLHFGTSTIRGRFAPIQGSAVTIDAAGKRGEVSLRLSTTTVSTGVPIFDARIRQPDLLSSEAFPEAFFVATRFTFDAAGQPSEVRGEFTLRGISQALSLRALRFSCRRDGPAEICGGDFEGEFRRSDFGISFGLPFVADRVRIQVQVEGRR